MLNVFLAFRSSVIGGTASEQLEGGEHDVDLGTNECTTAPDDVEPPSD